MEPHAHDRPTRRRTVLIVDDDVGTRHVMASGIGEVLGTFDVVTAENGREATEILASRPIDAIATDLAMPIMDGFSLIAFVANRKEALPVVAFSGLASDEIADRLGTYGGLRVLRKPVSFHEVAAALEAAIDQVEQGRVEGIPLASLLQLVQLERRSCTVVVTSSRRRGRLHFESGRLIDAFSDDFGANGEAAAHDILAWRDVSLAIEPLPPGVRPQIASSLQRLLLDVAADEDERLEEPPVPVRPPHVRSDTQAREPAARPADPAPDTEPRRASGLDARRDVSGPVGVEGAASSDGPPPGAARAGDPPIDPQVLAMSEAVARLTERVVAADEALARVADELDAFREARRRFDEENRARERRRHELEAFRREVADLAHALVARVDAVLDHPADSTVGTAGGTSTRGTDADRPS